MVVERPGSGRRVAAWILGGVGAVLTIAGALTAVVFPRLIEAERVRLESLARVDAVALRAAPPGHEVMLEGRVSERQPVLLREFVAYVREARGQTEQDVSWDRMERRAPALLVELGGADVLVHANYDLRGLETSWTDPRVVNDTITRYSGLVRGSPVVVVGTVAAAADGIDAEFVASGDRDAYLASQRTGLAVARWLGIGIAGVGVALLCGALGLAISAARAR